MQFAKWRTYSGHKGGDFVVHEAGSWPSYEETFSADVRELATFQDFIEQQRHIFAETGILAYALVALGRQGREDVIPPGATITAAYMFRDIDPFECRSYVEENYSALAMADRYEDLYDRVLRSARPEMVRAA